MKRHHLQAVNSPYVELECGGVKAEGNHIVDASKNPNFPGPKSTITLDLVGQWTNGMLHTHTHTHTHTHLQHIQLLDHT